MRRFSLAATAWVLCIAVTACGGDNGPTAPSSTTFNGQWSGTTSHGQPISFTVSSDTVSAVTVGYNFAGCSGSKAAADLNAPIVDLRGTPVQAPPDPYYFAAWLGPISESDSAQIQGFFKSPSEGSGHGIALFVRSGCGETIATWTATKR